MRLMFLGPPGAGKGTIAAGVRALLGVPHISTGALFRENTEAETELGLQVKAIMERGDLVPDEITVAMVRERLGRKDARKGFILDGFPRTIPQAEELKGISELDYVMNFICGDDELIKRLSGGAAVRAAGEFTILCAGRRRQRVYAMMTGPNLPCGRMTAKRRCATD